jgi:hypothetical protein
VPGTISSLVCLSVGELDRHLVFFPARELRRAIHRHLMSDDASPCSIRMEGELGIRISLGTYKLFYEGGTEWSVVQRRGQEEDRMLRDRARQREEDRRRRLGVVMG